MAARKKTTKPVAAELTKAMGALQTSLDGNPIIRQKLVERLTKVIERQSIPVAVLRLIIQTLEEYE